MSYSDTVRAAMEAAGLPMPDPVRVLAIGFYVDERRAIEKEQAKRAEEYRTRDQDFWAQP